MSNLASMFNLKEKQEMIKKKLFENINIFKPLVFNIKLKQNYKKKKRVSSFLVQEIVKK